MKQLTATRYVTPLREGGSLPAIVEADDDGLYVLKFRGAGQGSRALVAELIAGEIARAAGLRVPDIVLMSLDAELARTEPDPEIQDLIRSSVGLNLALDYLPGSVTFDPLTEQPSAALASKIVWLDAFVTNLDRTARNTNMLMWHQQLWLIDHGAALYFHHAGDDFMAKATSAFPLIADHVLLPYASELEQADEEMTRLITPAVIAAIVDLVPDEWLLQPSRQDESANTATVIGLFTRSVTGSLTSPEPAADAGRLVHRLPEARARRDAYVSYFDKRLQSPRPFLQEAIGARSAHL